MFARDPRHLQFEADVNRLFLYTRKCRDLRAHGDFVIPSSLAKPFVKVPFPEFLLLCT